MVQHAHCGCIMASSLCFLHAYRDTSCNDPASANHLAQPAQLTHVQYILWLLLGDTVTHAAVTHGTPRHTRAHHACMRHAWPCLLIKCPTRSSPVPVQHDSMQAISVPCPLRLLLAAGSALLLHQRASAACVGCTNGGHQRQSLVGLHAVAIPCSKLNCGRHMQPCMPGADATEYTPCIHMDFGTC